MEPNFNAVMAQCQTGDWTNFGQIYDHFLPKIYRFVYYRLRHRQIAEDLTSAIFLKVVQNMDSYQPNPAGPGPWLYRIARNTVIDHTRTRKETTDINEAFDLASDTDILASTDSTLKLEWVRKELENLSEIQREVLVLRVWDNLSHQEIAETLGISEANSKVSLSRAMQSLKQVAPLVVLFLINYKLNP
jgi:RNA polymerase sigma-70 factor (ECF subfamily)